MLHSFVKTELKEFDRKCILLFCRCSLNFVCSSKMTVTAEDLNSALELYGCPVSKGIFTSILCFFGASKWILFFTVESIV